MDSNYTFSFSKYYYRALKNLKKGLSIHHKGLKLFWTKGDGTKLQAEHLHRIKKVLNIIHYLEKVPQDLETFKHLRPHPLKGNLKGFWSLDISGNWRIIFRFEDSNAFDLDYLDTH